jgi:ankyrin repeat protein
MSLKKESLSDVQLHLAALNGDSPLLRRVLDSGKVHVDSRDKEGTTPLILASANGHFDCVKELLDQGADPKAKRIVRPPPQPFTNAIKNVCADRDDAAVLRSPRRSLGHRQCPIGQRRSIGFCQC